MKPPLARLSNVARRQCSRRVRTRPPPPTFASVRESPSTGALAMGWEEVVDGGGGVGAVEGAGGSVEAGVGAKAGASADAGAGADARASVEAEGAGGVGLEG